MVEIAHDFMNMTSLNANHLYWNNLNLNYPRQYDLSINLENSDWRGFVSWKPLTPTDGMRLTERSRWNWFYLQRVLIFKFVILWICQGFSYCTFESNAFFISFSLGQGKGGRGLFGRFRHLHFDCHFIEYQTSRVLPQNSVCVLFQSLDVL